MLQTDAQKIVSFNFCVFTSFLTRQTTGITRIPSCFRVIIYSIAYHTSLIFKQDFHSYRTQKVYIVGTSFSPLSTELHSDHYET